MNFWKGCKSIYYFLLLSGIVSLMYSCTSVRRYQQNVPFIFKNTIKLNAELASKDEVSTMESRLAAQLTDSAKVRVKDAFFVLHIIKNPPVFDTAQVGISAVNMANYMRNVGYYNPSVTYDYDTTFKKEFAQQRVHVRYFISSGKRTMIDTVAYLFNQPELEDIALKTKDKSLLRKGNPVTKNGIIEETNRLVEAFRNSGYYKFGADDIRVTGDTTIKALTTVSDDPFEQLQLLAEAALERDKPTIRLGYQLNKPELADSFKKYYIRKISIIPDYNPIADLGDTIVQTTHLPQYDITFHQKKFKNNVFDNNVSLIRGEEFRQNNYYKTINKLYKLGVWESPSIEINDQKDSDSLDLYLRLTPLKRYAFQGNIELSFSANSNAANLPSVSTGNIFGVSGNISITDRNLGKSAIRVTNSIHAGVEINTRRRNTGGTLINSREISFNNSFIFPKFIFPLRVFNYKDWATSQTFINNNISFINRLDFYKQQVISTNFGFNLSKSSNRLWTVRLFNFDYRRLYDRSAQFDNTLAEFPFLRYSFNTALIMGSGVSYTLTKKGKKYDNVVNKFAFNFEESGLIWGFLRKGNKALHDGNFFNKYLREYVKTDFEFVHTIHYSKSELALRGFTGIGIPIGKGDTTLPFFKQYFGGGPNSLRAWPVQGIGIGGEPLPPYVGHSRRFNDRTGDIQVEGNVEYRFDVAPLFGKVAMFKMAWFADAGNIWNMRNTKLDDHENETQFKFKNLYKQLGVSSGLGFRFDFNYFLIRFDMGFRFKRPDLWEDHAGWQFPDITPKHIFGGSEEDRIWRYQNFNATIGINYPF